MLSFLGRKLHQGFWIVFGILSVVFFLFQVLPGDPADMLLGQRADVSSKEAIQKEFYLDKPIFEQYLLYINDVSFLSFHTQDQLEKYNPILAIPVFGKAIVLKKPYFRRSFQNNRLVTEVISDSLLNTILLAIFSMLLATVVGIALGCVAALYKGTWIDHALVTTSILGISVPSFVVATVIGFFFAFKWHHITGLNLTGQLWEMNPFEGRTLQLKNLILPVLTLGIRPLAVIVQLTRGSMLEIMSLDYIRTARAKGLPEYKVIVVHALRNALNPVVTSVSGWLASLLAGAFFVEYIFDWKGLGLVTINAVFMLDMPVIMASVVYIGFIFTVITLFVDVLYAVLDPRVRIKE